MFIIIASNHNVFLFACLLVFLFVCFSDRPALVDVANTQTQTPGKLKPY